MVAGTRRQLPRVLFATTETLGIIKKGRRLYMSMSENIITRLSEGRSCVHQQQPDRKRDPSQCHRQEKLVVHGRHHKGDRAAVFYTLIGNCHREGINAEAYLTDLFAACPPRPTGPCIGSRRKPGQLNKELGPCRRQRSARPQHSTLPVKLRDTEPRLTDTVCSLGP